VEQRISLVTSDIPYGCSFTLISMSVLIRTKATATAGPERGAACVGAGPRPSRRIALNDLQRWRMEHERQS